ncbi:ribonuclease H-like domain-containing protein [Mycena olivaceomarginata]|nr:ribonuclease H-like domain-containing protein [Mycena olivaceomarginata]
MRLDDTFAAEEIVATDGSCFNNGQDDAAAGAGVFYKEGDDRNEAIRLPEVLEQSNQTAEIVAMKEAVQKAGDVHLKKIENDSEYALDAVSKNRKNRKKWEDQRYIGVSNKKLNKATVAALRRRKRKTKLRWVKGHNGHHRNEGADKKADEGAKKPERDDVPLEIPQDLTVTGAKLSAMPQSLAYRAIRECKRKKNKKRDRTQANLERAKAECEDNFGFIPTEDKIWKSQLNKDFSREQQYFLWMTTHDAYWVGTHWLRESTTAEMKERA